MGRQARLRRERREARAAVQEGPRISGTALRILRSIHRTIQGHCYENGRRCWEYLLEMMAQASGWQTESAESRHLWDKMSEESRWGEFMDAWMDEVTWAKRERAPFSEPFGELLEEIEGTNDHLGQFFTPMAVVRMMNQINLGDSGPPLTPGEMPRRRGLDPCCGTGRFMIDALVHHDDILMHGVDTDLWMVRTAMLNVRLLAKWTSLRVKDPEDRLRPLLRPLHRATRLLQELERFEKKWEQEQQQAADHGVSLNPFAREEGEGEKDGEHTVLVIGGRAIFIHGNSLIVDLNYAPNWLCAGWAWKPRPWESNLKIEGYRGTYDQWIEAGRPALGQEEIKPPSKDVQFDYSMPTNQPHAP